MTETEYFQGRSVDEPKRSIVLPFVIWALIIVAVIAICLGLPGCATKEEAQVCFLQYLGRTESGVSVVKQLCMTPEAFAESQK